MKSGLESGYCTAKNCRQFVRDGQGEQILIDGNLERYCERHRLEYWRARLEKPAAAITCAVATALAVILLASAAIFG